MKKKLALFLSIVMLLTLAAGCNGGAEPTTTTGSNNSTTQGGAATNPGSDSTTAAQAATRDTVTVLGAATNTTFDPLSGATMETWVNNALFDHLVRMDANGAIQPMLAESWAEESDGLTITFKLRQGMKSHDGEEIDADDVIFSFDTLFAVPNYYYLAMYMSSWEKVDQYTVKVVKTAAYCETYNVLATNCPVVSKDAYEALGPEGFAASPAGTGPYTLVSQGVDSSVTLKAYEGYWNGKPAIETLIIKAPMDMSTAVVALQNREIDLITSVPATQWGILQDDPGITFETTGGWSATTLCFMNNLKDDNNLRKAIYHGVNRDNAIIFGTEGTAVPCRDIYSALTMKELSGTFDVPGYDVELAREYLAKSDYKTGDEVRLTVSNATMAAVAQSIQNDMNQLGITIKIEQVDSNAFSDMMQSGELDLFLSNMGMAPVSTIDMLLYWETDNFLWGPQLAHDAEYDQICAQLRLESERDKLMELAHRAMEIQYGLANHLGIYESLFSVAYTSEITGVLPISVAAYVFYPGDLRPA